MDTEQHQKKREKEGGGEEKSKQEGKENQSTKQQLPTITSSPPSASSSPSHEFSFTISLHPSTAVPNKTKSSPPSFAIDLSPADDIFFHGHLLPLHLLSHLPTSPRSSTNSIDSFSLPIRDLLDDRKPNNSNNNISSSSSNNNNNNNNNNNSNNNTSSINNNNYYYNKGRSKNKSFSLFGLVRSRKGCEVGEREKDEEMKKKKKVRFNVSHILKRYIRIIRPLLAFRGRRENRQFRRRPYSFSGNLSWKGKHEWRGRRGESAPASMWTSPTNSGLLVATKTIPSSTNDSTMEELQSAIQAAIAHCKNSIAMGEEKPKC